MLHISATSAPRRSCRTPGSATPGPHALRVRAIAADPVDVATVRALWCALHPDAPVEAIVDELVAVARGRTEVINQAMHRLRSGRLERSAWVNGPALAVLEMALAEMLVRTDAGADARGADTRERR